MLYFIRISLCSVLLFFAPVGRTWNSLTDDLDLTCNQSNNTTLNCNYRPLTQISIQKISAASGQESLSIKDETTYPDINTTVAVLFVVDTSDPARQIVIEKNINHIEKLLSAGKPYHKFGLASFDKDLRIVAPIGSPPSQIISAAHSLRATGKTTELYRNVSKAVAAVAATTANRKAIIVFSDGQAEDRAYFHQDVIRAAHQANVIINSLGYPRTITLSVALQTIRRFSEESGGIYVEADNNFNLPDTFLLDPFSNIDRGGEFTVDLAPVLGAGAAASSEITLTLESASGKFNINVPVTNRTSTKPAETVPQQPQPIRIVAPVQEPQKIDVWLWYGIPVAFLILIVLTLIILAVTYQQLRTPKSNAGKTGTTVYKPYAYLVVQDESGIRYPITNTTWRIGRTRDNELPLNDKSVSRRHAEIQRYSNGKFVIFDVDSLNGVFVNSEQVKKKKLEEGDIIEIGDIYLRFTTRPADFPVEEDTVLQNTRTPLTH
ncbi:MAG: hypothetical protein HW386_605 [Gammaproteobacteria bacterium]|nr:hypothetical protein [Gammaproteobacteria bacterium]